jgi:hypothetical protein
MRVSSGLAGSEVYDIHFLTFLRRFKPIFSVLLMHVYCSCENSTSGP